MSDSKTLAQASKVDAVLGFRTVDISQLTDEQKKVLKDTVAKDATDTELTHFLNVSLAQDLNPFMKEVWFIKMGGRPVIMTSSDGYLKIAKRDPQFDSIQSAEVREGDHFRFDAISGEIEHRIEVKRGEIVGAYAIITRKDGKKFAKYVSISEYRGATDPWKKYTSAMIQKAAKSALCKEWANITGVMAEEIMPTDAIDIGTSPAGQEASATLKEDLLTKIESCKTLDEFNELKATMPPIIGKLFQPEKDEVFAAATKKRAELVKLDVPATQVKDAEIVDDKKPEEGASDEDATEADEPEGEAQETSDEGEAEGPENNATGADVLGHVIATLKSMNTTKELIDYWMFKVKNAELTDDERAQAEEVYERRKALFSSNSATAPKKRKAA